VQGYPTIRLYYNDKTYIDYNGERTKEGITEFIEAAIARKPMYGHHALYNEGCNVYGIYQVPRAPGQISIQIDSATKDIDPSLTNVSHTVKKFGFFPATTSRFSQQWNSKNMKPSDIQQLFDQRDNMKSGKTPFDDHLLALNGGGNGEGRSFVTAGLFESLQHYIDVIAVRDSSSSSNQPLYPMAHNLATTVVNRTEIPQAKFLYRFDPFLINLEQTNKRWYQYFVSLAALLGGGWMTMEIIHHFFSVAHKHISREISGTEMTESVLLS